MYRLIKAIRDLHMKHNELRFTEANQIGRDTNTSRSTGFIGEENTGSFVQLTCSSCKSVCYLALALQNYKIHALWDGWDCVCDVCVRLIE